jgi:DNA-binding NarL/FixJ family response regulator
MLEASSSDPLQNSRVAILHSVILELQTALKELDSGNRELVSIIEHLLSSQPRPPLQTSEGDTVARGSLSKREMQVLRLIVEGKTSKEIGVELGVSFKTAVTHRASIMTKMGVSETASVVREAIRRGLV